MPVKNQTPLRFKGEILVISRWVFFLATLVFLTGAVLFVVVVGRDHNAPRLAVRELLGVVVGTVLACYVVLIGYINRDAGQRGMSRLLWTLVAIFVPNGLGIVIYFVLRKPRTAKCPQCESEVEPGFSFCPRCGYHLKPVCPHCQRGVNSGDKFCPYCGVALDAAGSLPTARSSQL
jgi:RNA polymerase subunit RPABC4/transcription elongation factor Spt4